MTYNKIVTIDIISGFLGAGKTTFANRLLDYYVRQGERVAFIVNEFGNTGLDADIARHNGFKSVEISGGCVCCTLKGDVTQALIEVIEKFSPTKIVFEPSGIFVFDNFFDIIKDDYLKNCLQIGSVITIIDSINIEKRPIVQGNFIDNQIKNANCLILSKLERYCGNLDLLKGKLATINQGAKLLAKEWDRLTDIDFMMLSELDFDSSNSQVNTHNHSKIQSFTVETNKDFDETTLSEALGLLKSGRWGEIYRTKGIISYNSQYKLLNVVDEDVVITECGLQQSGQITFIGNSVNQSEIEKFWKLNQ